MRKMFLSLFAALLCAVPSTAAVVSIRPVLAAVLDENFSPVDPAFIVSIDRFAGAILAPRPEKYVLQIDVIMNISDLQPTQIGFGNAAFNINLTGVTQNDLLSGWTNGTVETDLDSNGSFPGGMVPKWADNLDAGPSGTDLQGIIIGTAPRNFSTTTGANEDPRRTLGIEPYNNPSDHPDLPGEYAGSIYVDLPGAAGSSAVVDLVALGGSTYDANENLTTMGTTATGGRLVFPIPEPSAFALLAACALPASWRFRRSVWRRSLGP